MIHSKRKRKTTEKSVKELRNSLFARTLKFTETVVVWVFLIYILNWVISLLMIWYAIKTTCNFSYLDTLITETGTSFREIVGIAVIKFGIENIFKYNDFGGKIPNKSYNDEESNTGTNFNDEAGGQG